MSPQPAAVLLDAHGARVVARRIEGPRARELFLHASPTSGATAVRAQAAGVYGAIGELLAAEGASFASVVAETVFLKDARSQLEAARATRRAAHLSQPATTEIGQAPLDPRAELEVALHAVVPRAAPLRADVLAAPTDCDCAECARAHGVRVELGDEVHVRAGALYGRGDDAYAQALSMFDAAERLLEQAGMEFRDVVRTWIYLRDIDRDYASLNRARRAFFAARGIDPPPASTGIGGAPAAARHDLCLAVHAMRASGPIERTAMSASTLNEAPQYGADFARGMRVVEANKVALHVSGTASVDERGRTAHAGDFDAQAARMLVNLRALLEGQGASFSDVVSAVTYVRHASDGARLRARLRSSGFEGFPHALVVAPICRPDLLCETEALAALPLRA